MPSAIEASGIRKDHAGEKALKGVSLQVPEGALFGLIGADGAGKSTLLQILVSLVDADAGSARVLDMDIRKDMKILRPRIGYMPQRFSLYPDLSVRENLAFFADIFGVTGMEKAQRMEMLLTFSALTPFQKRKAGDLSGGMKQKLALSCTLIHRPRVIFLDEPTVGVDPVARRDFWKMLKSLQSEGVTILVSTPYMDEAELCDGLSFLHFGESIASGIPGQLLKDYPYSLYRIEGPQALFPLRERPLPYPILWLYAAGGALHAVIDKASRTGEVTTDVAPQLRALFPSAEVEKVVPVLPRIEDFFMALLLARTSGQPGQT